MLPAPVLKQTGMGTLLHLMVYLAAFGLVRCAAGPPAERPLWTDVPASEWKEKGVQRAALTHYRVLNLDTTRLKQLLDRQQGETDIRRAGSVLLLPVPDGTFAKFRFAASTTVAPGPARSRAATRTYFGQGADDASRGLAFELGPAGFHAMVTHGAEVFFIEPASRTGSRYYLCYYKHDLKPGYRRPFEEAGPLRGPNKR